MQDHIFRAYDIRGIVGTDLIVDDVYDVMNIDNAYYSFVLSKDDFDYIKAKTSIEKENDILYLNINDNKLSLGENRWDHNICNIVFYNIFIYNR